MYSMYMFWDKGRVSWELGLKKSPRGSWGRGGGGLAAALRIFNYAQDRRRALKKMLKVLTEFELKYILWEMKLATAWG